MGIASNLEKIKKEIPAHVTLVAISKTKPVSDIMEAYLAGQRLFGENKVQEMAAKYAELPKDIEWHLVGHLQTNKVKFIAPFVSLIHSVDSLKLLQEINKQAVKNNRTINCLLQIYIAKEETKFGFDLDEVKVLLSSTELQALQNIKIVGMMGMATNTDDTEHIKKEFRSLNNFFVTLTQPETLNLKLRTLSMGMSSDYTLAIEEGSTLVRVGSSIFGDRNYTKL